MVDRRRAPTEQVLLGQFYTPGPVADLLVALTVVGDHPTIVDPGCGDGALLASAYDRLAARGHCSHSELLAGLWGFELSPAAAALAASRLRRMDPGSPAVPRIYAGDFFKREPGQTIAGEVVPRFDCVLGNPPYLRSQNQDDLDPEFRARLFLAAERAGVRADAKTDLFGFFLYHALRFMKVGGRLGFITPASWLTSGYAAALQTLLTGELRLAAIVASSAESFFPAVGVHTVLLVAERVDPAIADDGAVLRFVALRRPISALGGRDRLAALADAVWNHRSSHEDADMRVRVVPIAGERAALQAAPEVPRNWSRHLRAPISYDRLFGSPVFTPLGQIAAVSLGYKSLQNDFYYVDPATVEAHAIEPRFLAPILMLGDLDGRRYLQSPTPGQRLFVCRESEAQLRGTGALRYIHAMAGRPVQQRKQTGAARTIGGVLAAQGGGVWYGPKARPHATHVGLRKAFAAVYAPLLFAEASVVDQRCNCLEPLAGLSWELLAATLTTTAFAYAVEISGSASMGGGALEAPTTRLRTYPVFDPRPLASAARETLLALARAVWAEERPVDWGDAAQVPGPRLRALDAWVLARADVDLGVDRLHEDLRDACRGRLDVARTRVRVAGPRA